MFKMENKIQQKKLNKVEQKKGKFHKNTPAKIH